MFILQWFKSQKVKKPERVLPPMSPQKSVGQSTQQSLVGEALDKLRISIVGQSKEVAVSNLHHLCSYVIFCFTCLFWLHLCKRSISFN
jgi:hypothetical protein